MNNTPNKDLKETEQFQNYLKVEISDLDKAELTHLETEFENYKVLYPEQPVIN